MAELRRLLKEGDVALEELLGIVSDEGLYRILAGEVKGRPTVAYLGPEGTFTHEAASILFPNSTLTPMPRISDVVKSVYMGQSEYGVIPLENSVAGIVGESVEALAEFNVGVFSCLEYRVELCLVVNNDVESLSEVKEIYSHPHALSEARGFLSRLNIPLKEASSTAEALNMVIGHRDRAAVASRRGALARGLKPIVCGIEDTLNYTRFLAVKRGFNTRGSRTLLIFTVPNRPGSLYRALRPFAEGGVNLTMIYSKPTRSGLWEYLFIAEAECSLDDPACVGAIEGLRNYAEFVKVLGSYRCLKVG